MLTQTEFVAGLEGDIGSAAVAGGAAGDSHCGTAPGIEVVPNPQKVTVSTRICFPGTAHRVTTRITIQLFLVAVLPYTCLQHTWKDCLRKERELSLHGSAPRPHPGPLQPKLNTAVSKVEKYPRQIHSI